ncbi:urease accessory UreF family protein [Roseomonas sp. FDAARGOS_362]|uniref:urease accessory UreF family protein n=1 Tax=Roseomonas sp. FDAARGOS_362 TaxID=2018065 RepID=UPI003517D5B5
MAEGDAALYRLLAWISPAYPVGAYTYSHGLEAAVEEGAVRDRQGLADYIAAALTRGAGAVDGPLLAAAWRAARDGDEGGSTRWPNCPWLGAARRRPRWKARRRGMPSPASPPPPGRSPASPPSWPAIRAA